MQLPAQVEAALRDYDRRRDRAAPPVFVGRQRELGFLRDTVAAAQSGAEGITAVVQGVPGAGKSALCDRFEKELRGTLAGDAPIAVVAKECDFLDRTPASMVKELAADVPVRLDLLRKLPGFERAESHVGRALGVATALLKRGSPLDLAMQAMNLDDSSSLGATLDAFAEKMWPTGITLVLSIDEMQSMEDTPLVRKNLRAIHTKRFDTNIAIVGFGLQGTAAHLRELGLSRLGTDQIAPLGCMDPADAASLVDRTLDSFGLAADDEAWRDHLNALGLSMDDWREWRTAAKAVVLEESLGFPHHLVNGIRSVCRLILRGALRTPMQQRWDVLRQQCQRYKAEYYSARLARFVDHTMALAAALRQADAAGEVEISVVLNTLRRSDNTGCETDARTAREVLNGLIDSGLLARRGTTMLGVEIPSLAGYLAAEFDGSLARGGTAARKLAEAFDAGPARNGQP